MTTSVLVTGGCGFIGSNFIRWALERHEDWRIVNVDKLTYAGNPANLQDIEGDERYRFVKADISDAPTMADAMRGIDLVVHFAAESHVDRSLMAADEFIATNVYGTYALLVAARDNGVRRFVHVSTDEVYGPVGPEQPANEDSQFKPANPYAASKAAGELLARSFHSTYGLPVLVTRGANTIGPYQYPEKAVPLFVTNALDGEAIPLYGDGRHVRDRLYVTDQCAAIDLVLEKGTAGEAYNVWAGNDWDNKSVAEFIVDELGRDRSLIRQVEDRPGHDRSYYMDGSKLNVLGWKPEFGRQGALCATVEWYAANRDWWQPLKQADYRDYYKRQYGERLASSGAN